MIKNIILNKNSCSSSSSSSNTCRGQCRMFSSTLSGCTIVSIECICCGEKVRERKREKERERERESV